MEFQVLQKLLKYFNDSGISTSFVLLAAGALPLILSLDLNDSEFFKAVLSRLSLKNFHKLPDVCEKLWIYSIKLYIGITTSRSLALSTRALFISPMQSVNGEQLLNTTPSFLSPTSLAAAQQLLVLQQLLYFPLQVCLHHYNHINLTLAV